MSINLLCMLAVAWSGAPSLDRREPIPMALAVLQADRIVVGRPVRRLGPVRLTGPPGRTLELVSVELAVTNPLKGPTPQQPLSVAITPARARHWLEPARQPAGQSIWLLRRQPGSQLYRADQPWQLQPLEQLESLRRLIARTNEALSWGPVNNGLRAAALVVTDQPQSGQPRPMLAFLLANVGQQPLRICTHVSTTRLRIVDAHTGQALPVKLYGWLRRARLRPPVAADFILLDPGQRLVLNHYGPRLQAVTALVDLARLARLVRVELTATDDGARFELGHVWTGKLTSGAVSTCPPESSAPASQP